MPEEYRNIYKICRKSAGFTQEAAAERLGISVESLRAYETGQRVPPDEVVETMSDLYAFADSHADRRLMQMAEDNVIDSAERPEFDAIMEDLQGIVEAAMAVRYAKQGHLEEGVE